MKHYSNKYQLRNLAALLACIYVSFVSCDTFAGAAGSVDKKSISNSSRRKAIVLGFDGLDPRLCKQWMNEGYLPNFKHLAETGTFRELGTTYPSQSPVAWRTFATGVNPGNHGVFDFLRKIPGTYLPTLSTVEVGSMPILKEDWQRICISIALGFLIVLFLSVIFARFRLRKKGVVASVLGIMIALTCFAAMNAWLPREVPVPINHTGGVPFWKFLGENGVRSTLLRIPVEFPAREYKNARVFSGLGVPDIRGSNGSYTIFSEESAENKEIQNRETTMGGKIVSIKFINDQTEVEISGPVNPLDNNKTRIKTSAIVKRSEAQLEINIDNQTVHLREGEWSDWISITYKASPLISVEGKGRFHLLSLYPKVKIYLSANNFDPERLPPNIQLSAPSEYAPELCGRNGFFKTLGWPTDTWALTEEHISESDYLEDYEYTMSREKEVTLAELKRDDWDCFVAIFTPTDQIQHVFYRFLDSLHPLSDDKAPENIKNAIRNAYQEADEFTREVIKNYMDENTTLIILSDHGFHPFRKAVNINTWLWKNGYLKLKGKSPDEGGRKLEELYTGSEIFWQDVDWASTYAYSMGLGNIYLNLENREPEGIVRSGPMAELLLEKLREGLLNFTDPDTDEKVVRSVYFGKDLFQGKYAPEAADVLIGFHPGYRVSWQTALGGIPEEIIENNNRKWSGDHCSCDPAITPGILLSNRKLIDKKITILDAAPSVLSALDCPVPTEMEGNPWWR